MTDDHLGLNGVAVAVLVLGICFGVFLSYVAHWWIG